LSGKVSLGVHGEKRLNTTALEYAAREVEEYQEGPKMNGLNQVVVYDKDETTLFHENTNMEIWKEKKCTSLLQSFPC
jgi:hypothetical protein